MTYLYRVFTTAEVAKMLNITPHHVLRLAKTMKLTKDDYRSAGLRNHLFSKEGVEKLKSRK